MNSDTLRLKVLRVEDLPTIPTVISKIIEIADNEDSSARDITGIVLQDQSISSKVLKISNSAYFGFMREIETINQAIVILGFKTIKNIALGVSLFETFSDRSYKDVFEVANFWIHSLGCAEASKTLAAKIGTVNEEVAFTAGLLHDIGKLILAKFFSEEFCKVMELMVKEEIQSVDAEKRVLKVSHDEVGSWLGTKWKFPDSLNEAIGRHHKTMLSNNRNKQICAIAYLADQLTNKADMRLDENVKYEEPFQRDILEIIGIDEAEAEDILSDLITRKSCIEAFFRTIS